MTHAHQGGQLPAGGIGGTAFALVASFAALGPEDFTETFEAEEEWCSHCELPMDACCCPEGEYDDVDEIGGSIAW